MDEIPMTKIQAPNKSQFTNFQTIPGHWDLDVGYYLEIGAWSLVIISLKLSVAPSFIEGELGMCVGNKCRRYSRN